MQGQTLLEKTGAEKREYVKQARSEAHKARKAYLAFKLCLSPAHKHQQNPAPAKPHTEPLANSDEGKPVDTAPAPAATTTTTAAEDATMKSFPAA